jgi:hypothetical protein
MLYSMKKGWQRICQPSQRLERDEGTERLVY